MCLFTSDNTFRIATKDIRCYKVLAYYHHRIKEDRLATPYKDFRVSLGKTYRDSKPVDKFGSRNHWDVEGGVFHSYARKKDALITRNALKSRYKNVYGAKVIVVSCIIPKGTKYYVGRCYILPNIFKCYGSKRIKYIKEVR